MFGSVTALEGLHATGKYRNKHAAHMVQACGLGSSHCTCEGLQGLEGHGVQDTRHAGLLSHRMHLLISFRTSTPPQNLQLVVYHC